MDTDVAQAPKAKNLHQSPGEAAAAWPCQQWLRELGATCWSFLLLTRKVPGMAKKALLPGLLPDPQEELLKGVSTNWAWQFPNKQVTRTRQDGNRDEFGLRPTTCWHHSPSLHHPPPGQPCAALAIAHGTRAGELSRWTR